MLLLIGGAINIIILSCDICVDSLGHIFNYIHGSTNCICKVFTIHLSKLRLSQLILATTAITLFASLNGFSEDSSAIVVLISVTKRSLVLLHQI